MKNTFYILMLFIGVAFTGCEPMEDIHEEIDEKISNVEGSLEYTLEEEDYTDNLGLSFTSFDSEEDARELIPGLLSDIYPALGENSSVNATYNVYDPIRLEEYSVTGEDYEAIGLSENYFSGMGDVVDFLEYQFPQADQGDYVELTYNTLSGEESYLFSEIDFNAVIDVLADKYPDPVSSMKEHMNFDRRESSDAYWSNEMILEAINIALLENLDGVEGQIYNVSYDIYNGNAGQESMTVQFNGNAYVPTGGTSYELGNADYALVADELEETYPGPADNLSFNSFDIRESSDNYWSEEMIVEALTIILNENFSEASEEDHFVITYTIYNGEGTSPETITLVKENEGYIITEEEVSLAIVETTNVFAYTNGSWNMPLSLQEEDYTEMGQSYPNFDDEDEAIYKLAIFLESQFPYAQEGDFVSVAYDFYSGETTTEYANFIFEGGEFNYIPSVVEQTLQFSHNGSEWEPDNTIRYTLAGPDYDYIAGEFADVSGYEAAANNLAEYGNFNLNNWEDEMIFEALKVFLNNLDPSAEVGQKYILSYEVYPGYIVTQMRLIKDESGNWVLNNN